MRIDRVTRYVPTRTCSAIAGSDRAFVGVSLPRVSILEKDDPDARPLWRGRPSSEPEVYSTTPCIVPRWRGSMPVRPVVIVVNEPTPVVEPEPEPQDPAPVMDVSGGVGGNFPQSVEPNIPMRKMVESLTRSFGITLDDFKSQRRNGKLVRIRHAITWALIQHYRTTSLVEIGRRFNRDHTTILHCRDKVAAALLSAGLSTATQATPLDTARLALSALEARK